MASSRITSTPLKTLRAASSHCRLPASRCLVARNIHATSSRSATRNHPHALSTTTASVRPSATPATTRLHTPMTRSMFIQSETTPNEDSLKFIPGAPVMETGSAEFLDARAALASPLALRLFGIEGVRGVFYGPDFVTVTKEGETSWAVVKPEVYSVLMEHFAGRGSLFRSEEEDRARANAGPQDTRILDTDSETVAMIKELLDTRVRPAIMEDGGDIEYRGFTDDGIVQIKLKGSCRGCDSSTVTLKTGIERMLMHYIPEVKGTEQVLGEEEKIAQDEFSTVRAAPASKPTAGRQGRSRSSTVYEYIAGSSGFPLLMTHV
ncbi:HIRA-interacting protein 5 [Russula earlei]|uniref:HIRA-interacting protein 5 n=1 Tax=Russula earlei TaxID=71964 RepID=A0ACC0UKS5_9AGAM|nr:HIRA-interacting protein 5 [Russula earlei]